MLSGKRTLQTIFNRDLNVEKNMKERQDSKIADLKQLHLKGENKKCLISPIETKQEES